MPMFEKIKNPNAKPANIALAIFYVVVLSALLFGAMDYANAVGSEREANTVKQNGS